MHEHTAAIELKGEQMSFLACLRSIELIRSMTKQSLAPSKIVPTVSSCHLSLSPYASATQLITQTQFCNIAGPFLKLRTMLVVNISTFRQDSPSFAASVDSTSQDDHSCPEV